MKFKELGNEIKKQFYPRGRWGEPPHAKKRLYWHPLLAELFFFMLGLFVLFICFVFIFCFTTNSGDSGEMTQPRSFMT